MTNRIPVGVFFALFTVSGFAGLIYQSIWSHYLKLFLGHAAYAQTLVLAIFMGGMALGLVAGEPLHAPHPQPAAGLRASPSSASASSRSPSTASSSAPPAGRSTRVLPALGGGAAWTSSSGRSPRSLILPASILLGTTFPLMSAGIMRALSRTRAAARSSMLYFTNSFGAAVGVLASGFFLIDKLGLPGHDPHRRAHERGARARRVAAHASACRRGAPRRAASRRRPSARAAALARAILVARVRHRRGLVHLRDHLDPHAHAGPGRLDPRLRGDARGLHPRHVARAPSGSRNRIARAAQRPAAWLAGAARRQGVLRGRTRSGSTATCSSSSAG